MNHFNYKYYGITRQRKAGIYISDSLRLEGQPKGQRR